MNMPEADMASFDPDALDPKQQYKLMSGTIIPRPIALVTTLGADGVANAAPFSLFNMIGVDPPMLMFSLTPRAGEVKDTGRNLERVPEFVVHIVDEGVKEKMNVCSADFPPDTSEIDFAGLRTAPSVKVRPPRLVECPAQFECRLIDIIEVGRRPNRLVIGEVVMMHYRQGIVDPARFYVDAARLAPIGRLEGAGMYTRVTDRFQMGRPDIPGVPATSG
ncbi:Flavin reductase like domain protein [Pigmentiphaga humi]|uniref:Flavin reductase like domain protein n=1 Tax=Pigmentiphaga humi TaxID=2478468 RepID=A0A3P4AW11_9BURK|nr:flavin reductase family protein [Pigmentiphaga humi]VCU68207.1 Flavin reductase like domain protein [Pigmentiphaga humi]